MAERRLLFPYSGRIGWGFDSSR